MGQERDNFLVKPVATAEEASTLYEEMRATSKLPDFIISIKSYVPSEPQEIVDLQEKTPRFDNRQGLPDCEVTCICGLTTTISFSDRAETYLARSGGWRLRKEDEPDMHLPSTWFCGAPGHYGTESREMSTPSSHFIKTVGAPTETEL